MVHSVAAASDLNGHEARHNAANDEIGYLKRRNEELRSRNGELEAMIGGLRAELDRAGGHDVYVCMERDRDLMISQLAGVEAGTRLRFTDTHRVIELDRDGHWVESAA